MQAELPRPSEPQSTTSSSILPTITARACSFSLGSPLTLATSPDVLPTASPMSGPRIGLSSTSPKSTQSGPGTLPILGATPVRRLTPTLPCGSANLVPETLPATSSPAAPDPKAVVHRSDQLH